MSFHRLKKQASEKRQIKKVVQLDKIKVKKVDLPFEMFVYY